MLKTLLKLNFYSFFSSFAKRRDTQGNVKPRSKGFIILMGLLFLYCFGVFGMLFAGVFLSIGNAFIPTDFSWLFFSILALMVFSIDFIMTIFTAKSQLFEATDNEVLLSLPIRPRDILVSRMLTILITDYLFELFIAIPAYVVWIILGQFSFMGFICFIICLVFLPLLALSLACLVGWLLSIATSHMKNSAMLNTILSLTLFALYMLVCMRLQSYVQILIQSGEAIASTVKKFLYPFWCFGDAIANGNLLSCILFILCMVLPFILVCYLLARSFISVVTRKKGGKTVVYRAGKSKASPVSISLLVKELRHIASNSTYMLNAGIGLLFVVAIAIGVFFFPVDTISNVFELSQETLVQLCPAIAIALICFVFSMVIFSAPSVSLEGQNITLLQSLPIRGTNVLMSKVNAHLLLTLPVSVIASICCIIALPCNATMAILLIFVPVIFNIFMALFGVIMNLAMPRFDWTNDALIIKQSGATMLTMLGSMALIIVLIVVSVLLNFILPTPVSIIVAMLPMVGLSIGFFCHLYKNGDRVFRELK